MKQNQPGSEPSPADETDATMTDAGEKNADEDPDFDEQLQPQDDREPEVAPDDPDIQGVGDAGKPS